MMHRCVAALLVVFALAGSEVAAHAQGGCCGGRIDKVRASTVGGKPVRWLKVSVVPAQGDPYGHKALGALKVLSGVVAAELEGDQISAAIAVPVGFADYPTLEKGLQDPAIGGAFLNPIRLDLKIPADATVEARAINGAFAMTSGVLQAAPGAAGMLAVYADPSLVNPTEVVAVAGEQGLVAELTSHENLEVPVSDRFCGRCAADVVVALERIRGVVLASADPDAGVARVLVQKGRVDRARIEKALVDAGFDGERAGRAEACPMCHNRK